jgi:hypothetical protein
MVLSACTDPEREGEFVSHWIDCKRSGDGTWEATNKDIKHRFNVVHKSRYQVSFTGQHVVSANGIALKDCVVFDRENWWCKNADGSALGVTEGTKQIACSKRFKSCSLPVSILDRLMILVVGLDMADSVCESASSQLDLSEIIG